MSSPEFNFSASEPSYPWQENHLFGAVNLRKIFAQEERSGGELARLGKSGRLGLTKEGKALSAKVFEKIMNKGPYSPVNLDSFREGAAWFSQSAEDPVQKLVGRSLLAKTNYQLRKIICQIEAGKRGEEAPRSSAEIFRRTKGWDLAALDYADLENQYQELLFGGKLNRVLEKETRQAQSRIRDRLAVLGGSLAASWGALGEKISSSVRLTKKALPIALAALALIGLGFGFRQCRGSEKAGREVRGRGISAGSARDAGPSSTPTSLPTLSFEGPTPWAQNDSPVASEGVSPQKTPTLSAQPDLPLTGVEKWMPAKAAEISLSAGEKFVLEGPVFGNRAFLLTAVSPSLDTNFNFDEAVVCGYELSEEGPTVMVIHAGRQGGQILPGEQLKAAEKGGKMLVTTEKGEIKTSLLGTFRVSSRQFRAEAETLAALARQNGISLSGKCLFVVTCGGWSSADSAYLEKEVLVFSRINEQVLMGRSSS